MSSTNGTSTLNLNSLDERLGTFLEHLMFG